MTKVIVDEIPTDKGKNLGTGYVEMAGELVANYHEIELAQVQVWM